MKKTSSNATKNILKAQVGKRTSYLLYKSNHPKVFPGKCVLKICTKFKVIIQSRYQLRLIVLIKSKACGEDAEHHLATADNNQSTGEEKRGCSFGSACRGVDMVLQPTTSGEESTEVLQGRLYAKNRKPKQNKLRRLNLISCRGSK